MKSLIIEEYWNRVIRETGQPFGSRVLPEYEKKGQTSYPNMGGWESVEEWHKAVKKQHRFIGFDEQGRAKLDLGRSYGIHTYQLVSIKL